jgi:2-keto-4-pentenoate hydratase/2-oxohepta-3-ene-1,7-dioic acid hydratase in catechol pathway
VHIVSYSRGEEVPISVGVLEGNYVVDIAQSALSQSDNVFGTETVALIEVLRMGDAGMAALRRIVATEPKVIHELSAVQLKAPLPRPNTIRDFMLVEEHVKNSFGNVPEEWYKIPVHWKGNPDTVFGPNDEVPWPHYTDKLDYELEIAAVINKPLFEATLEQALDAIVGYTIFNDWSARDIQFREMSVGIGPAFGKDFATSMGPSLVTADSIVITEAAMEARINGEVWTKGGLGAMVFSFAQVLALLSYDQPLNPGDIFGSGTIGRGCGLELDRWIQPGDILEIEVEGIGILKNLVGQKKQLPSNLIQLTGE